ncbi:RabGAP/TBC domain-containing protein [Heterostelium album PN500]|uniref:RabGAP/TBC domain-containing protein n=1 Tax=Heterostelium pallidum (strain ATCC 26659 / Pp 5 / PN500) TaxID=670386 RepID=D3BJU9_HETP5|nr:RabGAP/TBC domain-containing protein [Heterostelium album PN500]EFA78179.1 RabGAP/TBC domain-containing protein [Heterostelium album PN500]|eukprot:XP_020430305.1 RabGAP/TBC domain-containing protein [Heterostelium album PN500]
MNSNENEQLKVEIDINIVVRDGDNDHIENEKLASSSGGSGNNNEYDNDDDDDEFLDIYGFRYSKKASGKTIEVLNEMAQEDETENSENWFHFIRNRCEDKIDRLAKLEHDRSFIDLVNKGIPRHYRKKVWLSYLEASSLEDFRKEYFKLLKEKETQSKIRDYKTEIKLDLDRTFPNHLLSNDETFKEKIQNILFVYSINNPNVGYCQSLNYISYILLLIIEDGKGRSFWCLNYIADKILPDYFTHTMLGAQIDQQVFNDLLCDMFPDLMNHFKRIGVVIQILTIEWFLCLFSTILPVQFALIIWDNLFVRGNNAKQILNTIRYVEYLSISNSFAVVTFLFNNTQQTSPKRIGVVMSRKKIQDLKLKHWQITKKQVKDNEEQKDIKYLMKFTSFSLDKLKSLKEEFDILSHDGTGIGYLQFHQIIMRFFPNWKDLENLSNDDKQNSENLTKLMEKMFEAMDEDNDRLLNFKELVKGLSILSQGTFDQKLRLIFKSFAIESKTYLTKPEIQSMIELAIFFKKIDTDRFTRTQKFLEQLEEHTTFEGLKKMALENTLILESFQTPTNPFSPVNHGPADSSTREGLKRRNEDRLNSISSLSSNNNNNNNSNNNSSNNNHNNNNNNNKHNNNNSDNCNNNNNSNNNSSNIGNITSTPQSSSSSTSTTTPQPSKFSTDLDNLKKKITGEPIIKKIINKKTNQNNESNSNNNNGGKKNTDNNDKKSNNDNNNNNNNNKKSNENIEKESVSSSTHQSQQQQRSNIDKDHLDPCIIM